MQPPGPPDEANTSKSPSPASSPSLADDLKEIQRYGSFVLLFASIPFIGIPGLIAKLTHFDEILGIWQLIANTAPLTLAVVAFGIAFLSGKFSGGVLLYGFTFALVASLFVGFALGHPSPLDISKKNSGGMLDVTLAILSGYFRLYGPWSFVTSFVVGGFLAWAWSEKLWPRIKGGSPSP